MSELMTMKQVTDLLGVTARKLRFWEEKGIVRPIRASSWIRCFDEKEVAYAGIALTLQCAGLSIDDIRAVTDAMRVLDGEARWMEKSDALESLEITRREIEERMECTRQALRVIEMTIETHK